MADKEGWIKTYRKIQDCWIWQIDKPFDERSAWIDLLLSANHKDVKMPFNGEFILVQRGQFVTSVRKMSDKWKWNKDRVLKFLRLLESDGMITKSSDKFRTLITIENYCIYQAKEEEKQTPQGTPTGTLQGTVDGTEEGTPTGTQDGHEPATNKNDKNDKNKKNINKVSKDTYCAEPKHLATAPVFIELILNDNSDYPIYQSDVDEWKELYPAVDVEQQLRSMKGWCKSNPTKRKTKRGIKKFINSWLSKEQDKYHGNAPMITKQNTKSTFDEEKYKSMNDNGRQ